MWAFLVASWPGVPEVQGLDGRVEASDLGNATEQEHQRGWPLPRLFEYGPRQPRVVAMTGATAIGGKVPWLAKEPACWACAVRTAHAIGVRVAFQPQGADALIQQCSDREVNYELMVRYSAR